ncbi:AaceriADL367Wp [[Ashbya] aceris (nom. inval.)]|nr:AaceriADL367Wp [[Ashbya] aceris (nom. inval.)]
MSKEECVKCPREVPPCPECGPGEQCNLTVQTCTACVVTVCGPKTDGVDHNSWEPTEGKSGSKVAVGAIVGGLLGGLLLLLLGLGLLTYYHKYWRKRKQRYADMVGSDPPDDEKAMYKATDSAGGNGTANGDMAAVIHQPRNRSSAATMATRASNVLPVAYIPGVTVVGKKFRNRHLFNNGDTRSHITLGSSILGGDDDDFDDDSEIGSQAGDRSSVGVQHANNLTTAIRAKPKLVQITEEDETEDTASMPPAGSSLTSGALPRKAVTASDAPEATNAVPTVLSQDPFLMDGEDDDHDKNKDEAIDSNDEPDDDDDEGSFILDVEVAEPIRKNSIRR